MITCSLGSARFAAFWLATVMGRPDSGLLAGEPAQVTPPAPTAHIELDEMKFLQIKRVNTNVVVAFQGTLLMAHSLLGPWQTLTNAASPVTFSTSDASASFFRLE